VRKSEQCGKEIRVDDGRLGLGHCLTVPSRATWASDLCYPLQQGNRFPRRAVLDREFARGIIIVSGL
jgi:hypothetical protein